MGVNILCSYLWHWHFECSNIQKQYPNQNIKSGCQHLLCILQLIMPSPPDINMILLAKSKYYTKLNYTYQCGRSTTYFGSDLQGIIRTETTDKNGYLGAEQMCSSRVKGTSLSNNKECLSCIRKLIS